MEKGGREGVRGEGKREGGKEKGRVETIIHLLC